MTFMLRALGDAEVERERVLSVEPSAGFAIKTIVESCSNNELETGVKYFINICHASQVPSPDVAFEPSIVFPLIMANRWEIPIVTSATRQDQDKKGSVCYVSDCCVNTACLDWARRNPQLKEILVEWCLESCELRQGIELSRTKLAFPKLRCKGASIPTLEVLKEELNADPKREAIDLEQRRRNNDPQAFLQLRRDLLDNEEDSGPNSSLPPLFPLPTIDPKKKLVEEIEPHHVPLTTQVDKQKHPAKLPLKLDVRMGKVSSHLWAKLKVEVRSELHSQQDYKVHYDSQDNTLHLETSADHPDFLPQKLQIPLPSIAYSAQSKDTIFFDEKDQVLTVLL
ncbi:LAME_0H10286g1_1 [Lachancea meyersii CBS 8951]|uniref:LAME_0H10286g1_1 n=1 Tax=Lachancea meyersii CBS 8951 TaxID=1266667 RepID=A0A1G4KFY5_9SACH|nr:LAME_0H10286g1_1 [Lachancea meyersii CBS 8951]